MLLTPRRTLGLMTSAMLLLACGGREDDARTSSSGGVTATTAGGSSGVAIAGGTTGLLGRGGSSGSSGTTDSGGRGGTSGTAVMPEECQLATGAPELAVAIPQVITFKLTNTQTSTRYLLSGASCTTGLAIYSCADGYQTPITATASCTLSCDSNAQGCIACGACMTSYVNIEPGQSTTSSWAGVYYTFEDSQAGCQCSRVWTAPSGKYRVTMPVYSSDLASSDNVPTLVSVDFTYPDLDGEVTLTL